MEIATVMAERLDQGRERLVVLRDYLPRADLPEDYNDSLIERMEAVYARWKEYRGRPKT